MFRCNSLTCCSNLLPSLIDIIFAVYVKRLPTLHLLQSIDKELKDTILRFQFRLQTSNSALIFVEKSILNRAFFSKQILQLVAIKFNIQLQKDDIECSIPTTRETLLSDQILKEIKYIESAEFHEKTLQNIYFQRIYMLKQIAIITTTLLPLLFPQLESHEIHFLATRGDFNTLSNIILKMSNFKK